eukprot:jgi/Pico_ML_1/53985/g4436.t1
MYRPRGTESSNLEDANPSWFAFDDDAFGLQDVPRSTTAPPNMEEARQLQMLLDSHASSATISAMINDIRLDEHYTSFYASYQERNKLPPPNLRGDMKNLMVDPFGNYLAQKLFERCLDAAPPIKLTKLLETVVKHALELCNDPYGNYVLQHALRRGGSDTVAASSVSASSGKMPPSLLVDARFGPQEHEPCFRSSFHFFVGGFLGCVPGLSAGCFPCFEVLYNFKKITVVPTGKEFVDIVLSRTQRQTPTVIHKGNSITRIRQFYMRKVKYTQQTYHDKMSTILTDFPKIDDIHPFYEDLLNVLYDKDHYKLALGQINTARNLVDKVSKEYVKLLKTIIVCGYPNVGKSSFLNKVSRANVDVQPYAFTTKSLYVGHTDYRYLRWQIIDTPGILDRPLEERNTIEMQSITALAHLYAVALYIVDVSEECGYTIAQQATLFHSLKPLFVNKPLVIACNKTDVRKLEDLSEEDRKTIDDMVSAAAATEAAGAEPTQDMKDGCFVSMSTLTDERVMDVKQLACEKLLTRRVAQKLNTRKANHMENRAYVAMPRNRDAVERVPMEHPALAGDGKQRKVTYPQKGARSINGAFDEPLYVSHDLEVQEWKGDIVPEIMDGKNIADFVDPEIDARLAQLEEEEEEAARRLEEMGDMEDDEDPMTAEQLETLNKIRVRKAKAIADHRANKATGRNRSDIPRTAAGARRASRPGRDEDAEDRGRKRKRSLSRVRAESMEGQEVEVKRQHSSRSRSRSRGASVHYEVQPGEGFKDKVQKMKAQIFADKAQRKRNKQARKGPIPKEDLNFHLRHVQAGDVSSKHRYCIKYNIEEEVVVRNPAYPRGPEFISKRAVAKGERFITRDALVDGKQRVACANALGVDVCLMMEMHDKRFDIHMEISGVDIGQPLMDIAHDDIPYVNA